MTRGRTVGLLQAFSAHCSLLCFSTLLIAKLEGYWKISWWSVFTPLWIFHGIVARGRFSLPAPVPPHDRQWAPCHTVVAIPLLVAFELLLCSFLASREDNRLGVVSLKVVFLPLLAFQAVILFDNFRMCRALMPGDEESLTDEAIWETLPHFWVAVSMVFFLAATLFTLLKLSGDVGALGWWDLFINFGIAECFAFLVCTKWSNPTIQRDSIFPPGSGAPSTFSPLISISPLIHDVSSISSTSNLDDIGAENLCGRQEVGGHLLKVPILAFQVLLCMRLERFVGTTRNLVIVMGSIFVLDKVQNLIAGPTIDQFWIVLPRKGTPAKAKFIPLSFVFAPVLLVQVLCCFFALIRLIEQLWLMLRLGDNQSNPMAVFAKLNDCCGFLQHGSRLLGWWSIDETSREEHARLFSGDSCSYNTFAGPAPEVVKKMARKDLAEEVWRLQAVLGEQSEITKHQQQEFDRLQNEKVLCRVCFERDIAVVLLPCRHRILCSFCSEKCKHCPVCRGAIAERMPVYDV